MKQNRIRRRTGRGQSRGKWWLVGYEVTIFVVGVDLLVGSLVTLVSQLVSYVGFYMVVH